jgi:L-amino acid N-acyltransferase YncA
MGQLFIRFAPLLGYKSSVFNLVFENNTASVSTWRKLGFREIGRVPKVGRLKAEKGGEEFVDAIMFYYEFGVEEADPEQSDDR